MFENIKEVFDAENGLEIGALKDVLFDLASRLDDLESINQSITIFNEFKNTNLDLDVDQDGFSYLITEFPIVDDKSVLIVCDIYENNEFRSYPVSHTFIKEINNNIITFNKTFDFNKFNNMYITYRTN